MADQSEAQNAGINNSFRPSLPFVLECHHSQQHPLTTIPVTKVSKLRQYHSFQSYCSPENNIRRTSVVHITLRTSRNSICPTNNTLSDYNAPLQLNIAGLQALRHDRNASIKSDVGQNLLLPTQNGPLYTDTARIDQNRGSLTQNTSLSNIGKFGHFHGNERKVVQSCRRQPMYNDERKSVNTRRKCCGDYCCQCSPLCMFLSILAFLLVVATAIAALVIALLQPKSVITTATSTTITTTDIPCSPTCTSQQTCVQSVCVGIGYLSCTLLWSEIGDGDIVVETPNYNIIYWNNRGPSWYYTDYGQLDVDNKNGTGPENVFWSYSDPAPPTGTYYVCFSQYSFSPPASSTNPITATVTVMGSGNTTLTFTQTFTSPYQDYTTCDSFSNTFLGSFTYP